VPSARAAAAGGRPLGAAPRRPSRPVLVAVAACALLLAGGAAAYALVSQGEEEEPARRVLTAVQEPVPAEERPTTPETTPDLSPEEREAQVARRMQRIVTFSLEGRTAVRDGRYAAAVANRRAVLGRLDAIDGTTGRVSDARRTLRRAMQASLESDIAYRDGGDASRTDAEATRLKSAFVRQWEPIAEAHVLRVYREGDF
jgi:hypothetical protein